MARWIKGLGGLNRGFIWISQHLRITYLRYLLIFLTASHISGDLTLPEAIKQEYESLGLRWELQELSPCVGPRFPILILL
jgi:hypothetical protein